MKKLPEVRKTLIMMTTAARSSHDLPAKADEKGNGQVVLIDDENGHDCATESLSRIRERKHFDYSISRPEEERLPEAVPDKLLRHYTLGPVRKPESERPTTLALNELVAAH